MSFDNSRFTFNPWNDYCGVVMEQGRVQLDSDWNEWLAELFRRIQAGTLDILGRAAYPATTPYAFHITASVSGGTNTISIGPGRMYVDGLLAENHGALASAQFDPALAEISGSPQPPPATETDTIDYTNQPHFPNPPAISGNGPFLAYLDVWIRPITYLEDANLVDKAVGVDTTGRLQSVWQVKLMSVPSGTSCGSSIPGFPPASSAGLLTTGTVSVGPSGPCCLTANTGYTGMENQFYRVEVHQPGTPATSNTYPLPSGSKTATFKWSRDNASVATLVTAIVGVTNSVGKPASQLTVQSLGRDQVLGFAPGNWIEILDDNLELNGLPGELHQIDSVDFAGRTITLDSTLTAGFPTDPTATHTRIRRWDQSGKIYQSDNKTLWVDLGAAGSTGDIPVPPAGTTLILENGITVTFPVKSSDGFQTGDFWTFAARTADGSVEQLTQAPPRGIHHHYAPLSIVIFPNSATDCRIKWPPPSSGGGCDCASCVTAQSHNSNSWTIQNAIDAVHAQGGGKVCLGPGIYIITSTVTIGNAQNLAICGHGLPLLQPAPPFAGSSIALIEASIDIDVDGIAFAGGAAVLGPNGAPLAAPAGLIVSNSAFVRVQGCSFGLATDAAQLSPAIALGGILVADCAIRGNLFSNVKIGIGLSAGSNFSDNRIIDNRLSAVNPILLAQLDIEDNQMFCYDGAVFLSGQALFVSQIRFARNFVQSTSGFVLSGIGIGVSAEDNTFLIATKTLGQSFPDNAAVVCNISETRVANNDISGWSTLTASALAPNPLANQSLTGGYLWIVSSVDGAGRETLITGLATLTLANQTALLEWTAVAGAKIYNVYRSVPNGTALFQIANVPLPAPGIATVSFTDTGAAITSQFPPLPVLLNNGIVLGSALSSSTMYGTQVTGNRISGLIGTGISSNAILLETLITENQMLNLGGRGILSLAAADLDIARNSLAFAGLLGMGDLAANGNQIVAGIQLTNALNVNLSENKIENLGPPAAAQTVNLWAIRLVGVAEVRIAGNRISDIGPTLAPSGGINGITHGRMDVAGNEVRRALIPPQQPDQTTWLALGFSGDIVSVQGNLLESFGGDPQSAVPGTVDIDLTTQCIFSNNQCFLDDPSSNTSSLRNAAPAGKTNPAVVAIVAQSIIAMGNRVQGPTGQSPSMVLSPLNDKDATATVIGNITSAGISVSPGGMPAAMAPLNITG